MTQPRAKRVHPKRQRPVRSARPTPERLAWVRAEIRRRLGVTEPEVPAEPSSPD